MRIRTRALAATVIAGLAGAALAGCSGAGSTSNPPASGGKVSGTLTGIFASAYKSTYEQIGADFKKKYPDVTLNFQYNADPATTGQTQLQAGTAPDILTVYPGGNPKDSGMSVVPLAAQGRIQAVTASWDSKIPAVWESSVEYNNKTYAYPGAVQALSAIYNSTLLDKLGLKVPTSFDQVLQLCSDAKSKGVYAYAQGLGDATGGGPQMLSFAQTASLIYGPDPTWDKKLQTGAVTYPTSKWVDAFASEEQMFKAGCFGAGALGRSSTQGVDAVAKNQALGLVSVGASIASMQASGPSNNYELAAFPATNDGTTYITALPGFMTAINSRAKNPAAAQAFLAFMGEPGPQVTYAKGFSSVPIIPESTYKAPAELTAFAQLVAEKKFAALAAIQPPVQAALNQGVQSMMLGQLSPTGVAQKMQTAFKKGQ